MQSHQQYIEKIQKWEQTVVFSQTRWNEHLNSPIRKETGILNSHH